GVDVRTEARHLVVVGDVQGAVLGDGATQRARVAYRCRQAVGVAVGQVQLCALGRQLQRRGAPDSARRAGQEHPLARERMRHGRAHTGDAWPSAHWAADPPHRPASHSCSSTRTPRCTSRSAPRKLVSPESISAVVTPSVRTSAGMSSLMGRAVPAAISSWTILTIWSITVSIWRSRISRIFASVFRALLHAAMIGSLCAYTAAALPTILLANAAG